MSKDQIFYDSLEEDNSNDDSSGKDLTESVPLYMGDIPKCEIIKYINKKTEKSPKPVTNLLKPKKSYLSMYYERKKQKEKKKPEEGSVTSRADCEKLSPKRESDLEEDLKSVGSHCLEHSETEEEEFYENFLALEMKNEKKKNKFASQSALLKPSSERSFGSFSCKSSVLEKNEKMELLQKRQNYGMKMSLKNRIKINEMNSIRKIKNSNFNR